MNNNSLQLHEKALENLHKSLLEALRQREQEILRYIAILGPALGGFIWLLTEFQKSGAATVFVIGTLGIILFLLVGAIYSIALGYSHQCFVLQIMKLEKESCFGIQEHIIKAWPQNANDISERCLLKIPWCVPPEVLKVFWVAFAVAIGGITGSATYILYDRNIYGGWILLLVGLLAFALALLAAPIWFGSKIQKICKTELEKENK